MSDTNGAIAALLDNYRYVIKLPILWGDMDAFQHVNNTAHFRWFESSRIGFIEASQLGDLMKAERYGPILVSASCNYRKQLKYPDTVHVGTRISKIGSTSIIVDHLIVSEANEFIAAEGQSVVVVFNYEVQRPVRIPDHVRDALNSFQRD